MGILSSGDFVGGVNLSHGDFVAGYFVAWDFVACDFVVGGFCRRTILTYILTYGKSRKTLGYF